MRVTNIRLNNYRNYMTLTLRPDAGLCVLTGDNAAGKTNILEAMFLCALGRSHRTTRDSELVRAGEDGGYVGLMVDTRGGTRQIEAKLACNARKKLLVDGTSLVRSGELLGVLNVVMFAPEDLEIVKGGPGERRRFLDMAISQMKPAYYYALQRYNAALKQRNAILKDPAAQYDNALTPWDEQLAALGAEITLARAEHIALLAGIAADMHETLSDGRETLVTEYVPATPACAESELTKAIRDALYDAQDRDYRCGFTTVGPHRDDLSLVLNGTDVRTFGSQGQQRTTVLSLKLAQLEMLREDKEDAPVLLLDDVFSELDKRRQQMLLVAVQDCQTFITCTHIEELAEAGASRMQVLKVTDGEVFEV